MPTPHGRLYLKSIWLYFRSYIYLYIYDIFVFQHSKPTPIIHFYGINNSKEREIDDVVVQKLKGRRKRKDFTYVCQVISFKMLNFTIGIEERKEL